MQSLDAAIISLMGADKEAKKREEGATHGEKQREAITQPWIERNGNFSAIFE